MTDRYTPQSDPATHTLLDDRDARYWRCSCGAQIGDGIDYELTWSAPTAYIRRLHAAHIGDEHDTADRRDAAAAAERLFEMRRSPDPMARRDAAAHEHRRRMHVSGLVHPPAPRGASDTDPIDVLASAAVRAADIGDYTDADRYSIAADRIAAGTAPADYAARVLAHAARCYPAIPAGGSLTLYPIECPRGCGGVAIAYRDSRGVDIHHADARPCVPPPPAGGSGDDPEHSPSETRTPTGWMIRCVCGWYAAGTRGVAWRSYQEHRDPEPGAPVTARIVVCYTCGGVDGSEGHCPDCCPQCVEDCTGAEDDGPQCDCCGAGDPTTPTLPDIGVPMESARCPHCEKPHDPREVDICGEVREWDREESLHDHMERIGAIDDERAARFG